jgi:hypothetical protein
MPEHPDDFIERLFREEQEAEERFPGSRHKRRERTQPSPPSAAGVEPWDHRPKRLLIQGVPTECFPIGALAKALNRQPVTIRSWELKGVMPKARIRDSRGRRWYTRRQVEGLIIIAKSEGVLDFDVRPDRIPDSFTERVIQLWKEPLLVQ